LLRSPFRNLLIAVKIGKKEEKYKLVQFSDNQLKTNETLLEGSNLVSSNQKYELRMQPDGNLVLYRNSVKPKKKPYWASETNNLDDHKGPYSFILQVYSHIIYNYGN